MYNSLTTLTMVLPAYDTLKNHSKPKLFLLLAQLSTAKPNCAVGGRYL